jgi:hypothetical protein
VKGKQERDTIICLLKFRITNSTHKRGGGVPFIGNWKTSHWSYQSKSVRPVHHTDQTSRVTPNRLRVVSEGNSLNWQIWFRTRTCSEKGQTSPMEFKFQWSNSLPDMSSPIPDKSEKSLWNPINRPNKSGEPDLL